MALDDWHWTLWSFAMLEEAEELDRLIKEQERIDGAWLVGLAFHEPNRLKDEQQKLLDRAGLLPSSEELWSEVRELIAESELAAARAIDSEDGGGNQAD